MIIHSYPGHDSDEGHGSPMSESPLDNALLARVDKLSPMLAMGRML
jgi:hypothetical protein